MAELKTRKTDKNVTDYINSIANERRKKDILQIKKIFDDITGKEAVLWNNDMIGYGSYHYKSDRSTQEGDWPITGFSSRKQNISIYIMPGVNKYQTILDEIGKHKASKGSCLYINKLDDISLDVFVKLIRLSFEDMVKMVS
jgi:Domain of unknown function (DU1801)